MAGARLTRRIPSRHVVNTPSPAGRAARHVDAQAENRLFCEPLDGAGNRICREVPVRSRSSVTVDDDLRRISALSMRFPDYRVCRAARKVRCHSKFSACTVRATLVSRGESCDNAF
jgi:hypothetical protein